MPFHLNQYIGGLGNQLFQVAIIASLAEKYDTTFSIPHDIISINGMAGMIPVYFNTIFSQFVNHLRYKDKNNLLPTLQINVVQFQDISFNDSIDSKTTNIIVNGLPMLYNLVNIPLVQAVLYERKSELNYYLPSTNRIKICVAFRTFEEENMQQWMTSSAYYEMAIKYMFDNIDKTNMEFHLFSDRENVKSSIIEPILLKLEKNINIPIYEYVGKRNNSTDLEHFFKMFDCNHFILCNSTFHYWAALCTKAHKSIVLYPCENDEHSWINYIVSPNWIKIDYD
jgi:hypothetical protein